MRVYIVGYMCSGKTKTGNALASAMRHQFLDTDFIIEKKTGHTIRDVFEKHGEEYFREQEKKILRETASINKAIIATGGGLPCYNENMNWMNEHGVTVYLEASVGLLFHRLATSRQGRPLIEKLNDVELMERISRDLVERVPVYALAKIKVNAANLNLKSLKEKIEKLK